MKTYIKSIIAGIAIIALVVLIAAPIDMPNAFKSHFPDPGTLPPVERAATGNR